MIMFEKIERTGIDKTDEPEKISEEERIKKYEEICSGQPDALYVLSSGLVQKGEPERTTVGSYGDINIHGTLNGGKARIIVAKELHKSFPNSSVITTTFMQKEGTVSWAKIAEEYLEREGIDKEKIIIQEKSYSTFTELIELIIMIVEKNWKHVAVITNEFQIPRAKAMLDHIGELHDPNNYWQKAEVQEALTKFKEIQDEVKINFVSAESVLPIINDRYKKIIDEARNSTDWKKTIEQENKGAKQINDGEYWKNILSTFIKQ